jgi:hypothetical protein
MRYSSVKTVQVKSYGAAARSPTASLTPSERLLKPPGLEESRGRYQGAPDASGDPEEGWASAANPTRPERAAARAKGHLKTPPTRPPTQTLTNPASNMLRAVPKCRSFLPRQSQIRVSIQLDLISRTQLIQIISL